jgi:phosphatidylserine decarboxylase
MIHKEGYPTLLLSSLLLLVISLLVHRFAHNMFIPVLLLCIGLFVFLLSFFRNPSRTLSKLDDNTVYAPADGKIVVIEDTEESEYLKIKTKQVSIFMSPLNVHVNRNPIGGDIEFAKYHPGSFLPAWEPKASSENERTTVVYKNPQGKKILMRQIAGALARRIVFYVKSGDKVVQGEDMGFIKFGSRVDLYLPLDADIKVSINQMVEGNRTVIATI